MSKIELNIFSEKCSSDLYTPVLLYLKLREKFKNALLLESSDFNDSQNAFSIICINPIAELILNRGTAKTRIFNNEKQTNNVDYKNFLKVYKNFCNSFSFTGDTKIAYKGLFGYIAWDGIPYFEKLKFKKQNNPAAADDVRLGLYKVLIVFNHYNDEISFIEFLHEDQKSILDDVKHEINEAKIKPTEFKASKTKKSNISDGHYKTMVRKCIAHTFRGDVFQIVPSRQFQRSFEGDDFKLYRSLRRINPSPYLFYFNYPEYNIIGSSPEAQTVIKNNKAYIDPIAGTFKRTNDSQQDKALAEQLKSDPKETSEHVMLVDLARNDLSRNSSNVYVKNFKEVHYFSHVLHMVSRVEAELDNGVSTMKVFGDAFPAGTLSGAPKYKAMKLLDEIEPQNRGVYGGALGYFGLDGNLNTAIVIRTFVSKQGKLYTQAGAGVVSSSSDESELKEVNIKLAALDSAIEKAQQVNK